MKCHIPRENNILSCIYFSSFVLQIKKLFIIFNCATNAMETNRVKERVFYMSCFDRFTKLKRNDEIEVSVPLISFAIWQIFVWPSHAVRSNTLYALNRLIDSYRFFYESSRYLAVAFRIPLSALSTISLAPIGANSDKRRWSCEEGLDWELSSCLTTNYNKRINSR